MKLKVGDYITIALILLCGGLTVIYLAYHILTNAMVTFPAILALIALITFTGLRIMFGAMRSSNVNNKASFGDD